MGVSTGNRIWARLVLGGGTLVLAAFFVVSHARWWAPDLYNPVGTWRFPWTIGFLIVLLGAAYATGLPGLPRSRAAATSAAVTAVITAVVAVSIVQLMLGTPLLPRAVVGGISLVFVPLSLMAWNLQRDITGVSTTRILFVGRNDEFGALSAELANEAATDVVLVGHLASEEAVSDVLSEPKLVKAATDARADLIILDSLSLANSEIVSQAASLHERGMRIRTSSLFSEEFLGKIPVADLERVSLLFDIGEIHRAQYVRAKRVVDVIVGIIAVTILIPLAAIVFFVNLVGNKGSLIYSQTRVGKDGEPFEIYKFRSMVAPAPDSGPAEWTTEDDPRITPFGSFLRKTHLDELPQAWNILRGDLSIVGPRPEQLHYVDLLRDKIPFYDVRHLVRPGVTGWAQIKYPYGANEEDAREKLQYDLYYLRRQSLALDLSILVRTTKTVLFATGK